MEKFAGFILKNKVAILIIYIILIILSVIGFIFVDINSDVTSYLPKDSMTKKGKDVLEDNFNIKGELNFGISNLSKEEVANIISIVNQRDNERAEKMINRIAWLGEFDEMNAIIEKPDNQLTPQEIAAKSMGLIESYNIIKEKFYNSENDTYIVFMYLNKPNSDDASIDFINDLEITIKENMGDKGEYFIGGGTANARTLLESSLGEIPKYLVIAVIFIAIVLLLTTRSYIEPFIFLLTLGISIIINLGSNVIMGEVSSITFSATAILQLALSMDYSIFLMHSFYEEKKDNIDTPTALRIALPKTLKAIAASALTTVGGFVALFTMKFGMGYDLGIVLAKGVFLSLITVIFLQPIIIMLLDKKILRTSHKYFEPHLKKTGDLALKFHKVIIIVCILLAIPTFIIQFKVPLSYLTISKPNPTPSKTEIVMQKVNNQIILAVPIETEGTKQKKQYRFIEEVKKIEEVESIFSMYSIISENLYNAALASGNPLIDKLGEAFVNNNYALYTINIKGEAEDQSSYDALNDIKAIGDGIFGQDAIFITGVSQGAYDLSIITPKDFIMVSLFSALIILIILIFTFKSFILSFILLFVVELGIWINLSLVTLSMEKINFMSYIIISSIELGGTVDYAILLTSKYLEERKNKGTVESIKNAVFRSSPSILVSASVLIIACISVYAVTSNTIVAEITMLIARGAILSVILVMTLLPAILYLKDKKEKVIKEKANKLKKIKGNKKENLTEQRVVLNDIKQDDNKENITESQIIENKVEYKENISESIIKAEN